jgi:hypothetical protein
VGVNLVKAAVINHASLSDRAFRVLVRMCLSALDERNARGQPPGVYWGGWEPLALVLGRRDLEDPHARRLAQESVRRATQELVAGGLITPLLDAHRGTRQSYRINLFPTIREEPAP